LKKALEGDDLDEIKAKKEALEEEVQALSVKLYEQAQKEQAAQQGNENADDDVVDAEYEEVEDEEDKEDK